MDNDAIERQFNRINDALMEFSRQMGGFATALDRGTEDRKEIARALGAFRDDIQELSQLGPMLKNALGRIDHNSIEIRDVKREVGNLNDWRQQQVGRAAVKHGFVGLLGGCIVLAGDFLVRWVSGLGHP